MRKLSLIILVMALGACQGSRPGSVMDNVLSDFGLKERPEGYESTSDRVMKDLENVGKTDIKRLNMESRAGEIAFEETGDFQGLYYKRIKVYQNYYPLDAAAKPRRNREPGGYTGRIEYSYRIYEGARKRNRTLAAAEDAKLQTNETGHEIYRYDFTSAGTWRGGKGELVKRR